MREEENLQGKMEKKFVSFVRRKKFMIRKAINASVKKSLSVEEIITAFLHNLYVIKDNF